MSLNPKYRKDKPIGPPTREESLRWLDTKVPVRQPDRKFHQSFLGKWVVMASNNTRWRWIGTHDNKLSAQIDANNMANAGVDCSIWQIGFRDLER